MTIQHRLIPNAELHEPKDVATAPAKSVYVATGTGSGVWRLTTPLDINNSDKTKNINGWDDLSDSLYTSGSPRAIAANVRTQLTNNGLGANTDVSRLGAIWNTTSNQFLINDANAVYHLRISFKLTAAAAAGTPYIVTIELQSDTGPTVVLGSTNTVKGGGGVNFVMETMMFNNNATINNSPLKIFVTPDTAVNIYDIGYLIQRGYKET